jgi:sugar phosphate isomerase/epimerase
LLRNTKGGKQMAGEKKSGGFLFAVVLFLGCSAVMAEAGSEAVTGKEDWRLAVQAWTFNKFTFYEAVDKTAALGLEWIEAYPGQPLSKDAPGAVFHHTMPAAARQKAKDKLAEAGVRLVNYGVVPLPNDEKSCREVFDFARDMGIETIVSEPPAEAIELVDRLCREYKIKVAIHNHPKPSPYWDPNTVLAVCKGRSSFIGACADTGHWMRSGLDALESLRKLQGRIVSLHFKDLTELGNPDAHDTIWGSGKGNVDAMLAELSRQKFAGVFSVEYEYNWENSMPDIARCVQYFDRAAAKLGQMRWRRLFNGHDLAGWIVQPGSWAVEPNGVLAARTGPDIWTEEQFGDFVLDLEFKLAANTNSGVFLRTGSIENWLHTAIEVQVFDSYGKQSVDKHDCGAIFDCLAPSKNAVKKPGEWNRYVISCRANKINVELNGQQIVDMDLDRWTEPHKNPDGTPNKFNTAYKDMPRKGHIGLQYHGQPVWYRNIRIKPLPD